MAESVGRNQPTALQVCNLRCISLWATNLGRHRGNWKLWSHALHFQCRIVFRVLVTRASPLHSGHLGRSARPPRGLTGGAGRCWTTAGRDCVGIWALCNVGSSSRVARNVFRQWSQRRRWTRLPRRVPTGDAGRDSGQPHAGQLPTQWLARVIRPTARRESRGSAARPTPCRPSSQRAAEPLPSVRTDP